MKIESEVQEQRVADFERRKARVLQILRENPRISFPKVFEILSAEEQASPHPPDQKSVHAMLFALMKEGDAKSEILSRFEIYWHAK